MFTVTLRRYIDWPWWFTLVVLTSLVLGTYLNSSKALLEQEWPRQNGTICRLAPIPCMVDGEMRVPPADETWWVCPDGQVYSR